MIGNDEVSSVTESELPVVIGLGEVLWDVDGDEYTLGGAPANVAFHAAQFQCRGVVASRIGADRLGDGIVAYLNSRGLDLSALQRDTGHATGCVIVDKRVPSRPQYDIRQDVAWDFIAADEQLLALAGQADAICFGSLAQRSPVSRETIHRTIAAARPDCLVVFDVNLRQQWWNVDVIERSLRAARIAKLNQDEVATLAPLLGAPVAPGGFAAHLQQNYGVQTVCITRADEGCLLVDNDDLVELPGIEIRLVDAVGAGDAFSAALIAATLDGWPLRDAGLLANEVGALVASHAGAMPDLRPEFALLWERFRPERDETASVAG